MLFLEDSARLLLLLHAVLGAALVGVTSHVAWWSRDYSRGKLERHRTLRRLALVSAVLFVTTFVFGNLIYPTYKIRVRGELLESGDAVADTYRSRVASGLRFWERHYGAPSETTAVARPVASASRAIDNLPRRTAKLARWFDVKEHWVALGMLTSVLLCIVFATWKPDRDGRAIVPVVRVLATSTASVAWFAAIIGIITASYRSVGGFG